MSRSPTKKQKVIYRYLLPPRTEYALSVRWTYTEGGGKWKWRGRGVGGEREREGRETAQCLPEINRQTYLPQPSALQTFAVKEGMRSSTYPRVGTHCCSYISTEILQRGGLPGFPLVNQQHIKETTWNERRRYSTATPLSNYAIEAHGTQRSLPPAGREHQFLPPPRQNHPRRSRNRSPLPTGTSRHEASFSRRPGTLQIQKR